MLPVAIEFARRGWASVVLLRRGYGTSGGNWAEQYGTCDDPDYVAAGSEAALDLQDAIAFLAQRPDMDADRIISVGWSAGGFATVALSAEMVPGLRAAISLAGGRGSLFPGEVCKEDRLIQAFRVFGMHSRVPMLWIYAQNDSFFSPDLARRFFQAFTASGGKAKLIEAPTFGNDGHGLFSASAIPIWLPLVDVFLKNEGLDVGDKSSK
jgi:dienelactone hydrolase